MKDIAKDTAIYNLEDERKPMKEESASDTPLYTLPDTETDTEPMEGSATAVEEESSEPLYEIDDNEIGGINYAQSAEAEISGSNAFVMMLRIMFNPVNGWKDFKREKFSVERLGAGCFYPLLALASLSQLCEAFYGAALDISEIVVKGMITFITFFFSYFMIILLSDFVMKAEVAKIIRSQLGKGFVMIMMSTLVLFYLMYQVLPIIDSVLVFLPIWTLYLICRGVKVLRLPPSREKTTTWKLCVMIIGVPAACGWLFHEIFV